MKLFLIVISFMFFLKPLVPLLDYVVNYDYIVNELCENKENGEMACNGKCHLMKELAKSAEEDNSIPGNKNNSVKEFEVLFLSSVYQFDFTKLPTITNSFNITNYSNLYAFERVFKTLRPPAFIF